MADLLNILPPSTHPLASDEAIARVAMPPGWRVISNAGGPIMAADEIEKMPDGSLEALCSWETWIVDCDGKVASRMGYGRFDVRCMSRLVPFDPPPS